jgi:uncharacterized membrane protein
MSDASLSSQFRLGSFAFRFLIATAAVVLVIGLSFGDRLGKMLSFWAHANFVPHAPNLALIAQAPPAIKVHLAAVLAAVGVGLIQLLGVKGTLLHRTLGWSFVIFMVAAAASSLLIREINHGAFSYIHLLSAFTLVAAPLGVYFARTHRVASHGRMMVGLFFGGLVLAGVLAFLPGRLMWQVFFR